jgi:hypothetical protein
MKQAMIIAALGLCLAVRAAFAFDARDTKPIVALEVMGQKELAGEAVRACQGMIMGKSDSHHGNADSYRLASQYLQTVGLVLRTKNNEQVPRWYTETVQASLGDDPKACAVASLPQ